jgi:hypothetical protein
LKTTTMSNRRLLILPRWALVSILIGAYVMPVGTLIIASCGLLITFFINRKHEELSHE